MKRASMLVLLLALANLVYAQTSLDRVETGEFGPLLEDATHNQVLATLHTFFGRSDLNEELPQLPKASHNCPTEGARQVTGSEWVLSNADDRKVVMFNENHYGVEGRAFLRKLLPQLREEGFTHLGLEAFRPSDDGAYSPSSGYYTHEPLFAALVRDAFALGFMVFGYEAVGEGDADDDVVERFRQRETGQAMNIQAQISSADDESRFIIFAGWSHIAKSPVPAPGGQPRRWMAARLMERTGLDPLSIDLTACVYEANDPEQWRGRLYLDPEGEPLVTGRDAQAVDAQIRLPVPEQNHPAVASFFRQSLGQPVAIPESLRLEDEPVLIQARRIDAPERDIAHDRVLLNPGEDFALFLPNGQFEVTSHRKNGEVLGRLEVELD